MKTIEYPDWLERSKKVLSYLIYKRKRANEIRDMYKSLQ
jgi:hypothetical protein